MTDLTRPIRLLPLFRNRVWGRRSLAPYFEDLAFPEPVGEAWFTSNENQTSAGSTLGELLSAHPDVLGTAADPKHPGVCPLLVKLLFTTERLSVQVHPDDEYAQKHHGSLGKTEAWYVLDASPPAEVAVGLRESISPEAFRKAAESGELERMLNWRTVTRRDVIFVPAGTVHAIGAGLTICEIQENSDITYRLYDYGRPRELHLDHGTRVSHLGPATESEEKPVRLDDWREEALACNYFRIERWDIGAGIQTRGQLPHYVLMLCTGGAGEIGGESFTGGDAWFVPAGSEPLDIRGESTWIVSYTSDQPARFT
jgi:mannose-6-phosphate isomerase